ncbi:hematopoietic progenitor cell antigen CD34 [Rhineura floridana]|uniref:hematopoietic progenitor cell antigen CD34 n=1 Tax=Rhineura floridana TaxID=261503 RepID=UPI002AC812DE|nr:hematopoietic progenitor cell antigen CD34 [Rhineura floridana]
MSLWTFKAVMGKQFFWTAFCVLSLLENQVAGDEATSVHVASSGTLSPETSISTTQPLTAIITSKLPAGNSTASTSNEPGLMSLENSTEAKSRTNVSSSPATLTTKPTSTNTAVQTSPTQERTSYGPRNETAETISSTPLVASASTVHPKHYLSGSPTTIKTGDSSVMPNITCINIKNVTTTGVICLELSETYSCHKFKTLKGMGLREVVCKENQPPCHIKLAESEVNRNCILLVEVANKGANALEQVLQQQATALEQLGIKPHKQEDIQSHKNYSRKTLIALVTSGLLLAFLGLAGYFLMKRRTWSPMGERLGEDPYYTENSSHGNTVTSVASHEQSDLQDKPNFNGGARENGTGQHPSSKNGHSTKPHVVADTEL